WSASAVPFEMVIDLNGLSTLDELHYLCREDGGNGTITKASFSYSTNKEQWSEPVEVNWARNGETKVFKFEGNPSARYIKMHVTEGVGNYGSGREMYIFKVAGSETFLSGDINKDKKVDENDLTSYLNYNGLRKGDSDFEYVSIGDVNENNLIDAYDISVAATRIGDGIYERTENTIAGNITIAADKKSYKAGEEVVITISGKGLANVNAFSLALPYNPAEYDYVGIEATGTGSMANYSKNRMHTNGETIVYPTFVNEGNQNTVNGDVELVKITLKAKKNIKFNIKAVDGIIVDKHLNTVKF
ncbi:MAG: discoidin domain-containing protein, partial [Bacteroidaceae bacterium]|nr:discoidin domain-containing protein [Bacteroidaceae bacterium]